MPPLDRSKSTEIIFPGGLVGHLFMPGDDLRRGEVLCVTGYALRLKEPDPNAGSYLPCENFEAYQRAIEAGKWGSAQGFLLPGPNLGLENVTQVRYNPSTKETP